MTHNANPPCVTDRPTGLAHAVLPEIAELLARLSDSGQSGEIDLRSLPMNDGDRRALAQRLGRGEIHAVLNVAGNSEVWETAYSGVWWVRHLDADGKVAAEHISISRIPDILVTHPADIHGAAERIQNDLAFAGDTTIEEEAAHV
jgi:hydrogenase-1 operon protein HyaF